MAHDVLHASRATRQMASAARAFLDALNSEQRGIVQYADLGDPARTRWTNLPAGSRPRPGVGLGDLNDQQRVLLHDLLRVSTSSQGYHKMAGAIRVEQVLHDIEHGNPMFSSAFFYTAVFGSPDDTNWAWMITGHHMNALFTVAGDRTAFTPMFTGAQPVMVQTGLDAGWQVLPHEVARASDLLASLSTEQQRAAILGPEAPRDIFAGPARQSALSRFQGVSARQLDAAQQRLLRLLVEEFVRNAHPDAADAQLALIQNNWSDLHFAWQGPPASPAARYYFRVHGPRILIEYDVQEPLTRNGGHVHSLTRDPLNDYGMDWLGLHLRETDWSRH